MKLIEKSLIDHIRNTLLQVPIIQNVKIFPNSSSSMDVVIELKNGEVIKAVLHILKESFPMQVKKAIDAHQKSNQGTSLMLAAPYISERTHLLCKQHGVNYFDHAGNCLFIADSIYLCEHGNKNNVKPKEGKSQIFDRNSIVSYQILVELMSDIKKKWKLSYLAESVSCSIGQVSKVKDYLCKYAFAEMTKDGIQITDVEGIMQEWAKEYGKKTVNVIPCYSLDGIPEMEHKLKMLQEADDIDYYLTGFCGGVRYAPVVQYQKMHVYIPPQHIHNVMNQLHLKQVDSGANILIYPMEHDAYALKSEKVDGINIASPIQVYLDCMQLEGRGEEIANEILRRSIMKHEG